MVKNVISIENARIIFRNFSGKQEKFNPAGKRNFCVLLDDEIAKPLYEEGWNIKMLKAKDGDSEDQPYLQVSVAFGNINPKIILITSKGKTELNEDDVNILDWAEIRNVDLIIRPYNWILHEGTKEEKKGVKAYLKTMYVVIQEDEFEKKYVDIEEG